MRTMMKWNITVSKLSRCPKQKSRITFVYYYQEITSFKISSFSLFHIFGCPDSKVSCSLNKVIISTLYRRRFCFQRQLKATTSWLRNFGEIIIKVRKKTLDRLEQIKRGGGFFFISDLLINVFPNQMISGLLCTVTNILIFVTVLKSCVKNHNGLKINTVICHEENFVMGLFRPQWEVRGVATLLPWLDCEWYRAFKGVLRNNWIWLEQAGTKYIVPHTQSVFGKAPNVCLIVCN